MSSDLKQKRSLGDFAALFSKGIAMGMGDSVPGISGGTIAVISGIYEELIGSISRADFRAVSLLLSGQLAKVWAHINGNFLIVLAAGVLAGLLVSANSVLYLLENYFEALMGFFIGLVLASTYFLKAEFQLAAWLNCVVLALGAALVIGIAMLPQQTANISFISVFFYGAIAICAMILPGLSGAFILLLFGIYEFILNALVQFQFSYIVAFAAGCLLGLLAFAKLLSWVLRQYREQSYSFLTGMLIGSVITLWPWQQMAATDEGAESGLVATVRLSPFNYLSETGSDPQIVVTGLSLLAGAFIVLLIHKLASASAQPRAAL